MHGTVRLNVLSRIRDRIPIVMFPLLEEARNGGPYDVFGRLELLGRLDEARDQSLEDR